MLPLIPKQATGPPAVAICEMLRSLSTGVKVLSKGMGWVNWAPAAPMKVTMMLLSRVRGCEGAAQARVEAASASVAKTVEVYMVMVLCG